MKVKCKFHNAKEVPETIRLKYSDYFVSLETNYDIAEGLNYIVYGVSQYRQMILYLILPYESDKFSFWYPAFLFDIEDYNLSPNWFFKYYDEGHPHNLTFMLSYEEMVFNINHYEELIEREPFAIEIFKKRKLEFNQ